MKNRDPPQLTISMFMFMRCSLTGLRIELLETPVCTLNAAVTIGWPPSGSPNPWIWSCTKRDIHDRLLGASSPRLAGVYPTSKRSLELELKVKCLNDSSWDCSHGRVPQSTRLGYDSDVRPLSPKKVVQARASGSQSKGCTTSRDHPALLRANNDPLATYCVFIVRRGNSCIYRRS